MSVFGSPVNRALALDNLDKDKKENTVFVVKLKTGLEGLGEAGDLVVARTELEPRDGDFVISELKGRRVIRLWAPGVSWLATVVHVFT